MTTTSSPSTASATAAPNPYLQGPFGPVAEEVTVTDLAVTGHLPEHLDGRYLRNGPNPLAADPATYHWFDGEAMVHGIRLRDGRAEWYRNRWVRTVEAAHALGEPRPPGTVNDGVVLAPNINIVGQGGRFYATAETGVRPYELTDELDTIGPCSFDGTLPGGYTGHPHRDPVSGDLHAISYFLGHEDRFCYQYSVLGTDGRVTRLVELDITGNPLMHDFALTENHVVLLDLPVTYDIAKLRLDRAGPGERMDSRGVAYLWDAHLPGYPASWDPDHPARLGLLPRDGGSSDIRWFPVEPCYVFHPLNAYEERSTPGGPAERVVLDVMRFPTMFTTDHRGADAAPTLDRWIVDLASGAVRQETLDDRFQEFPRHDERRTGRRHRYGYTTLMVGGLLKHDLDARSSEVHSFGPGDFVGEMVFVPAAADSEEDDGVLMGLVYRGSEDRSDLVLLDAGTLETVATVHLPVQVPVGFHGNWIPS